MQTPDPTLTLSQFLGSLPTFIAVLLGWMQSNARSSDLERNLNRRIDDSNRRIDDVNHRIGDLRTEIKDVIKAEAALVRAEFHRVEEILETRLKHLEEREP